MGMPRASPPRSKEDRMKWPMIALTLGTAGLIGACTGNIGRTSDPSLYLTGTEESYIRAPDGTKTCNGHKVLICHIPPGNPANAHTICVSEHAVPAHQSHHGDPVGECANEPNPPPDEPPPQEPPDA